MRCPTTCRCSPSPCSPIACCSRRTLRAGGGGVRRFRGRGGFPAGGGAAGVRWAGRSPRRGARALAAPALALRDPLGIAVRRVGEGGEERVLVLPRVHPVTASGEGSPL